ncbi:MAG TPA: Fic/DOC family N-terminal domain-containing protein [Phenylobacterium sp.]|uniref:Fic family protein n=1 Tax=Phenylobacterium sp. TaxID=1871053 RepID=UPI002F939F3B
MSKTPCIPETLPLVDLDWRRLLPLAGRANGALARYDGMLQTLPNPAVLLSPITVNEAVLSSRIEGAQATLEEVFERDAGIEGPESRRGDIEEISNYRAAVGNAEAELLHRPISLSLIKSVHQRLMHGVRGRDKAPGAFREDQNWIGRQGDPIEKARFIPPSPLILTQKLGEWEAYLQTEDEDPILQTAIAHAQFEILHPFKDGNGRIGRMLIPLLLYKRGALSSPMFYLSEYLEAHRDVYYDHLLAITNHGDWQSWVEFFVGAVIAQAESNLAKVKQIRDLYERMRREFVEVTHSQYAGNAVDAFFARPVIRAPDFREVAGFNTRVTANNMLRQLEGAGLIRRVREGSGQTPSVYALPGLINIAEGRPVF